MLFMYEKGDKVSVYVCPVCRRPLVRDGGSYRCENRHVFDVASSGYVNLSPPSSGTHGDDAEMVAARRAFLHTGNYDPLCALVCEALSGKNIKTVLDAGCGEGYYTKKICEKLPGASVYGLDISKKAAEKAAKYCKDASFCVASAYRMPYADSCFDAVVNVFSPLALDEYSRVLSPGGFLCLSVSMPDHLIELKRAVYDDVFVKEMKEDELPGYDLIEKKQLRYVMDLQGKQLSDLFMMTPYARKTSYKDKAKLGDVEKMNVTASFAVFIYKKIGDGH